MTVIDTRGIPSHACLNCGGELFKVLATFEDYDIATWSTDGYCVACGAAVTVPCPVDNPERV